MPPSASSNRPGPLRERAGEGAARVPEQLGLEQLVAERRAIDRAEAARVARRQAMHGAGDQLLPAPALTFDQHRKRRPRGAVDIVAERGRERAVAEQVAPDDDGGAGTCSSTARRCAATDRPAACSDSETSTGSAIAPAIHRQARTPSSSPAQRIGSAASGGCRVPSTPTGCPLNSAAACARDRSPHGFPAAAQMRPSLATTTAAAASSRAQTADSTPAMAS